MQRKAEDAGFKMVEQYVGHGIGQDMHEAPQVPNYVNKDLRKNGDFARPHAANLAHSAKAIVLV